MFPKIMGWGQGWVGMGKMQEGQELELLKGSFLRGRSEWLLLVVYPSSSTQKLYAL